MDLLAEPQPHGLGHRVTIRGGVNVAFGGGRVIFLRENIDYQTYIALMTMNERISDSPNPKYILEDKHYQ
jgi:hypothetical protein